MSSRQARDVSRKNNIVFRKVLGDKVVTQIVKRMNKKLVGHAVA
jgi:hypothetical protein